MAHRIGVWPKKVEKTDFYHSAMSAVLQCAAAAEQMRRRDEMTQSVWPRCHESKHHHNAVPSSGVTKGGSGRTPRRQATGRCFNSQHAARKARRPSCLATASRGCGTAAVCGTRGPTFVSHVARLGSYTPKAPYQASQMPSGATPAACQTQDQTGFSSFRPAPVEMDSLRLAITDP